MRTVIHDANEQKQVVSLSAAKSSDSFKPSLSFFIFHLVIELPFTIARLFIS